MPISRYENSLILKKNGKSFYPSSGAGRIIKQAVDGKRLPCQAFTLAQGQRLDIVAANYYGSSQYWWVIAAASGIGWQCQVPAGTVLLIPSSIEQVANLLGY